MSNYCKYKKLQEQVSYDSGQTWSNVVPATYSAGTIVEEYSTDCQSSEILYRWKTIPGEYMCDGHDRYNVEMFQMSTDGINYRATYPSQYRPGSYIDSDSRLCDNKWEGHYVAPDRDPYINPCPTNYYFVEGQGCVYSSPSSSSQPSSGGGIKPYRPNYHLGDGLRVVDPIKTVKCSESDDVLKKSDVAYNGSSDSSSEYKLYYGYIGDCVTEISANTFSHCERLSGISITSGVTTIGNNAFEYCYSLSSATIPDTVTSIGIGLFTECSGLTTATLPITITNIPASTFYNCKSLSAYTIPNGATEIKENTFLGSGLQSITIPEGVTNIASSAFTQCNNLKSVSLPDSLEVISNGAFYNCNSLTSLTIPSSVTAVNAYAFDNCISLQSITILPEVPPSNIKYGIDDTGYCPIYVHCSCYETYKSYFNSSLASRLFGIEGECYQPIPVPADKKLAMSFSDGTTGAVDCNTAYTITSADVKSIKSDVSLVRTASIGSCVNTIKSSAFRLCGIECISIPNSVTSIEHSAFRLSNLKSIVIPDTVISIDVSIFEGCAGLRSATLPNGIQTIPRNTFSGCTMLESIEIPQSVTVIDNNAFRNCYNLKNVTIHEGLTEIGDASFYLCRKLINVTLPSTLKKIYDYAFYGCTSLENITINRVSPPTINTFTFVQTNNCPIYVPAGSVNTYKSASVWSNYADRIQAIII